MIPKNKFKKAFGIVEVLIASTIIIVIVFTLTAAANSAMNLSDKMQERAQATQYAQEAIEIVRQMRDSNWIDGNGSTDWNYFVGTLAVNPVWSIPTNSTVAIPVDYKLLFNANVKRFYLAVTTAGENIDPDGNASFRFNRKIKFESVGSLLPSVAGAGTLSKDEYSTKMTVTVTTPTGDSLSLSEILTNWRPQY
jgi:hypothetical protein